MQSAQGHAQQEWSDSHAPTHVLRPPLVVPNHAFRVDVHGEVVDQKTLKHRCQNKTKRRKRRRRRARKSGR